MKATHLPSVPWTLPLSCYLFLFLKGHPQPLFHFFGLITTNTTIFTTNLCEKMSIQYYGAGIQIHNLQIASLIP